MEGRAALFLSEKRIAVAGVSRTAKDHGANLVYRRLKERGYTAFAVNPKTDSVEGDRCYPDLRAIPGGVNAVVIATPPSAAASVVHECLALGIRRVWMHQGPAPGSVSADAVLLCEEKGIDVIAGGCPLMFGPTSDLGHRCLAWYLRLSGALPRGI